MRLLLLLLLLLWLLLCKWMLALASSPLPTPAHRRLCPWHVPTKKEQLSSQSSSRMLQELLWQPALAFEHDFALTLSLCHRVALWYAPAWIACNATVINECSVQRFSKYSKCSSSSSLPQSFICFCIAALASPSPLSSPSTCRRRA